jgi:hypothetical protein
VHSTSSACQVDQRCGDQHAESHAAGAYHAVGKADSGGVTARVQVKQRGAGRTKCEPRSQSLHGAGDKQPRDRVGEHEQDRRADQHPERRNQHRTAANLIRDPAGEE